MASEEKRVTKIVNHGAAAWGFPSLLTYIGAAIYFVGQTDGAFLSVVGGLLQAIVWPVYVVYHVLKLLGA
ncbi:MAG: hypothetical protein ABIP74_01800 [Candidatus Saccharimonas sp.]